MTSRRLLALALGLAACHSAGGTAQEKKGSGSGSAGALVENAGSGSGSGSANGSGSDGSAAAPEGVNAEAYVPAEFKSGMSRWKDTGVYLDGEPIGFLNFDELPIALKPTWVKDKVSANKPPGCPDCPAWKWSEQRFYKFTDYLKSLGVDITKIKTLHVLGPHTSETIVVSGAELQSAKANDFMFHFGAEIFGKPIPHTPPNFGNNRHPDKINGVMIYIKKKAPDVTQDGLVLDGIVQEGVPYYGEPLRGGVRIYLDDRLATIIKRQELDTKKATTTPDGELHWNFGEFLTSHGVNTSKLVEGWVIRDGRRQEEIPYAELSKMSFSAGDKAHGGVFLGDKNLMTHVIALHSRKIPASELPVIRPEEEP